MILIQTDVISDNIPNFDQLVKIWDYCIIEVQLFQFISIPSFKDRSAIIIFLTFRMMF